MMGQILKVQWQERGAIMPGVVGRAVMAMAARTVGRTLGGASGGPVGLAIGMALPMVTRALGPAGMVGLALGSWAVKQAMQKKMGQKKMGQKKAGIRPKSP